ncbi:MAG: hypothetical protein IT325_02370 [Anaerolineae bacterium]|nr:hypothetical protein [Anaerolineae bacterium]
MTDPSSAAPRCLYCERTADEVALIPVHYRDADYFICASHLPILIHRPEQLADYLPGAEGFGPSAEH